jgi:hypothetical protein
MHTITIPIDDLSFAAHKREAERSGTPLEEQFANAIRQTAPLTKQEVVQRIVEIQTYMRETYGEMPDSTPLIREMRDSW